MGRERRLLEAMLVFPRSSEHARLKLAFNWNYIFRRQVRSVHYNLSYSGMSLLSLRGL